jgi:type I restriction enzyme S subunit
VSEERELPEGWVNTKLEDICTIIMGQSPPSSEYNENGVGLPFFQGKAEFTDLFPQVRKWCTAPTKIAEANDILLSVRAPVGPTNLAPSLCCIGRGLSAIRPDNDIQVRYVLYAIRTFNSYLTELGTGTTFAAVSGDDVRAFEIPLAPLSEQQRIVAGIEQQFTRLDVGAAALQRARKKLKRYRAAVLKAAVEGKLTETWRAEHPTTEPASVLLERIVKERRAKWEADLRAKGKDPGKVKYVEAAVPDMERLPELPEGWCWATVEQLIYYLRNGLPQKPESSPPGHRILRINAVRPMSVDLDEVRYLQLPEQEVKGYFLDNGDILFTRYNGSLELLGVAGMVRGSSLPTLHPDKLIRIKTVLAEPLSSYVELASNVGISRAQLESKARTTAGQTGISGSDIKQVPIPLPPLLEQGQIVAEVERHLSLISQLEITVEASLKRAERLRQNILREAFAGRLVPQDPDDESASVLLERIRGERGGERERKNGTGRSRSIRERAVKVPEPGMVDVTGTEQVELWEGVGG